MPSDLAPQIKGPNLDTDLLWVIGNIHELSNLAEIHENEIVSPAPFCHFPKDIPDFFQSLSTEVDSSNQDTALPTSLQFCGKLWYARYMPIFCT